MRENDIEAIHFHGSEDGGVHVEGKLTGEVTRREASSGFYDLFVPIEAEKQYLGASTTKLEKIFFSKILIGFREKNKQGPIRPPLFLSLPFEMQAEYFLFPIHCFFSSC